MKPSSGNSHPEWTAWIDGLRAAAIPQAARIIQRDATRWSDEGRGQYKCCSPLRKEKTPSFYIYPDGGWHDFGTGESGDIFAYIMQRDRCSFVDACTALAEAVGHPTWAETKRHRGAPAEDPKELLVAWDTQATVARFWQMVTDLVYLCHAALPTQVRDYLRQHYGFFDWLIDFEKIGYVPPGLWEIAVERFRGVYTEEELLSSGFFVQTGSGPVAHCAGRILFPYWKDGLCRYTIGRQYFGKAGKDSVAIPPHDSGKYKKHLTHSERRLHVSALIHNDVFWGEDALRLGETQGPRTLIITEGVADALSLKLLDYPVISPVTVTFAKRDIDKAIRVARPFDRVVILNDADELADGTEPGKAGALRMATALWAAGIEVAIGRLPKPPGVAKTDINEIVRDSLGAGGGQEPQESRTDEARSVIDAILARAEILPSFLLQEIPEGVSPGALEEHLQRLGTTAARMTPLQQADLLHQVFVRFPKAPKKEARRTFQIAVAEAQKAAKIEARKEEAKTAQDADAHRKAEGAYDDIAPLRGVVHGAIGFYERRHLDGRCERISSFSLDVRRILVGAQGPDRLVVRVTGIGGQGTLAEEWLVPTRAWSSKRAFIQAFPSAYMQWSGTDDEVQGLQEHLLATAPPDVPRVASTAVIGVHAAPGGKGLRFVLPAGTIGPDGWMDPPDVVYAPEAPCTLDGKLPRERTPFDTESADLLREALTLLPTLHAPSTVATIAGGMILGLFRAELLGRHGHAGVAFAHLYGSPGSGKTAFTTDLCWRLFNGIAREEPFSAAQTPFAMARDLASTNALTIVFDEYKPADMGKSAEGYRRMIRRAYNGDTETRGRADLTVLTYTFAAHTVTLGEARIDEDAALTERHAIAGAEAAWILAHPPEAAAFRALLQRPLWKAFPHVARWRLTADTAALLTAAEADAAAALATLPNVQPATRVRLTLVQMLFALRALDALCAAAGAPVPAWDRTALVREWLSEALDAEGEDLERGGHVPNAFDLFVAEAAHLANVGLAEEGLYFDYVADDAAPEGMGLFLYLRGFEALRTTHRRAQGGAGVSPGERALYRMAREMENRGSYVLRSRHRLRLQRGETHSHVHGVLIDPTRLPAGADAFPRTPGSIPRSSGSGRSLSWEETSALANRKKPN